MVIVSNYEKIDELKKKAEEESGESCSDFKIMNTNEWVLEMMGDKGHEKVKGIVIKLLLKRKEDR